MLEPHIHELSSKLYKLSEANTQPLFFGMLAYFIDRFPILTDMYCVNLVGRFVERINKEVR